MGAPLYSLCVPSAFFGRAGFDIITSHIFPQGVLAAITLVGGWAAHGRARTGASFEPGLPLSSVAIITQVYDWIPNFQSRIPEDWVNLPLFTLSVCSSISHHWHLCSRGEQCWCKRGPYTLQWDGHRQMPLICHLCKNQQCLTPPFSDTASGLSLFCPSQVITTPSLLCLHPLVADRVHVGFGHVLGCGLWWSSLDQTSGPPLSPWCPACLSSSHGRLHLSQILPHVQVTSTSNSQAFSLVMAPSSPVWSSKLK